MSSSLFKKKPLSKNLCLSLTGKESVFNNVSLCNNFPIALMIISKMDPISCRIEPDSVLDKEFIENQESEIKIKYMNEHAKDLFELKDNENSYRIKEQLKQFKLLDSNKNNLTNKSDDNLLSIIFNQKEDTEFFASFKSQIMFVWIKLIIINDDIYICADYFTDERKRIQNELFQSIKFQYIATLFHELYNPINAILVMMEQNKFEDDFRSNLEFHNVNSSDIEGSYFSLITENEFEKIDYNLNGDEENNNENNQIQNDNKENENYNILKKKYQKCKQAKEYYQNNYNNLKEKEKDVRLLVNIIYIFLENLILYLRLNIGENKDNLKDNFNLNNQRVCLSENNSQKSEEENINDEKDDKTFIKKNKIQKNSKSFDRAKTKINRESKVNNELNSQLYQDNYFKTNKENQKINLEILFTKHLKKFSYLFKYKNIQFFRDFSFLSNKYIYTYESIFSDFLGQIYSFLYYVIPKFHGFEISFSTVSDNKMKLTFQKANCRIRTGYTHKKFQKKDSFLLIGNKFKASSTVKTIEMTIEIMHKLAQILGINVKIMDYEEQTEEKYLTVLMPFYIGKDIHQKEKKDENAENFDSFDENLLLEKTIKNLENIDMDNIKNENLEEIRNKTNKIIENINAKIITNVSNNSKSNKKVAFFRNDKDINTSIKDNNSNINRVNINININKNININNNFNSSSISSFISNNNSNINNKNISHKSISDNYIASPKLKSRNDLNVINNNKIPIKEKGKNILTLIHEKYSFLDRLKKSGVEILTEKENNNENEFEFNNNITYEGNNKDKYNYKEQNSMNVEADSENFIEIENDIINTNEDGNNNKEDDTSEEIIFNNNYNNINLKIGDEFWNVINKNKNNVNLNNSPTNRSSNSIKKVSREKKDSILKNKKKKISNKNLVNKYYNKTLSYSKSPKDMLFVIPEINENTKKERLPPHPSCKLNNKYVHEFAECDCNDILLVDDDEFICKSFKNILKKFKLKADSAENGKECLKLLKEKMEKKCKCEKNKYKIIFMDITMPVMDGIEAAKNIQKMIDNKEINDNIKIIFISAHANLDLSASISGIKCAVDYYAKPISADKYKKLLDQYYYKK